MLELDVASLSLADLSMLENLPLDILLIILSYLKTARSVASLASTCKKLHAVVRTDGWRIFLRSHFESLALPQSMKDEECMGWTRDVTGQSRAWDRRAFSVASFIPPVKKPHATNGHGGRFRTQTFPPHIIVDATSKLTGSTVAETIVWGAGEDLVIWRKRLGRFTPRREESWTSVEGAVMGFASGKDDVTALSIVNDTSNRVNFLVGRASGYLQLLSTGKNNSIRSAVHFQPIPSEGRVPLEQKEIQHLDINNGKDTAAVITKDSLFFYPLNDPSLVSADQNNGSSDAIVAPKEAVSVRNMENSKQFRFLKAVRFMGNGDLALGMTYSPEPLRYLKRTPSGVQIINAAKLRSSRRCTESYVYDVGYEQSIRDILPLSTASIAGGGGNVTLSSYDDATIRLQDLRSPSPIDTIYQDHFEVSAPVGPLVSHGMERFVAGSARTATLKIFDFRWTKGYVYTDALPCGVQPLVPTPKPPTMAYCPHSTDVAKCNHRSGVLCNRHILARSDFYRPNCTIYLPPTQQSVSPVYSLAKPSDLSSTIYAGLTGELVQMSLRDQGEHPRQRLHMQRTDKKHRSGYSYQESPISIIETGDGIALHDITKSQRMPEMHKQNYKNYRGPLPVAKMRAHRLDDLYLRG
ncbi:hypothetical protein BKA67DRAFT_539323 [Truncatella angustata]|uniref:F-box domain-containing protein n=1 Tax=Truncatella angustata TaxID=152316 RepID=A0A9P8RPS6_9PEZI|nr:uncharacterized protein BKA67DRAFT_539323 [Truncatella angustata]KAH6647462.1 hypothetical protein BKA67DRAFT_539323 [Truncatella angustata]KAH8205412.1 hypothetical protein TruAng_000491 [Truncatella angustata]